MDVLDDILDTLDLRGALYFRTDFSPPWAIRVPQFEQAARFHLVVQGRCHVRLGEGEANPGETLELGPGDLVLIPRGRGHVIADAPDRPAVRLQDVLAEAGFEGSGVLAYGRGETQASTQMVCGHFAFRRNADHPLLAALPDCLVVSAATRAGEPWLDDMLRLIPRRLFAEDMGSEAAATRLSEIVFIELLRVGIHQDESLQAVLEAFGDRFVGRALTLMHRHPEEPWTLDRLAGRVGLSRSRFAERFKIRMGTSAMAYLSDWRLQRALALLDDTRRPVQQVAHQTGYRSPAAFTRAFAGKFGVSPSEYRRAAP